MKHILLITTGGTIASAAGADGLVPTVSGERLLEHIPEVGTVCDISVTALFNLDSTNMRPEYWLKLAMKIREEYHNYDGFVVTHGTDTMAYAAGMLHFLIQNSQKPIVLTGAQTPIENRDTDARENLRDAFIYASDKDACGIHVVFGGKVISAARARKNRTRSANAFSSVDYPEIGFVRAGEMRYSYFAVEKIEVDESLLVNGATSIAWDQAHCYDAIRGFEVTSQLPWTAQTETPGKSRKQP